MTPEISDYVYPSQKLNIWCVLAFKLVQKLQSGKKYGASKYILLDIIKFFSRI